MSYMTQEELNKIPNDEGMRRDWRLDVPPMHPIEWYDPKQSPVFEALKNNQPLSLESKQKIAESYDLNTIDFNVVKTDVFL